MSTALGSLNTAGTRISTKFLSVLVGEIAGTVKKAFIDKAKELEIFDYIYVVDDGGVLRGVIPAQDLLQAHDEIQVGKIMKRDPIAVDYSTDQERIIYLVLEHDLKAMPVIDGEKRLLGIVPYHTILDIFHHEFREDILRSGGIHHQPEIEDIATAATRLIRARLPSLILGLLGGLLAAYIVTGFEQVLSSYLALAAFIPIMVYLSDAVGTQSQTLVVRMLALKPDFSFRRYLVREVKVGGVLGITFAALLFAAAFVGWGSTNLGLIVGASMFVSIVFQAFVATYLSTVLSKFRIDPAVTSGPLTTIMSDITSLAMYFAVASTLLKLV